MFRVLVLDEVAIFLFYLANGPTAVCHCKMKVKELYTETPILDSPNIIAIFRL